MYVLKSRRGEYSVPHLMRWRDREAQPDVRFAREPLVARDTPIAAIGSCFAERVVEVLEARDFDVWFHSGGLQYNTFSIAQEFDHLFGPEDPYGDEDIVQTEAGGWEHLFRKSMRGPTRAAVLEKQRVADAQAREAYRRAELVVITLGLTEIWQRSRDGLVAVELPPQPVQRGGDFVHRNATVAENVANLERIRKRLAEVSDCRLLVTVSPVPLSATFRPLDILVANCESKSRLRAAVADFRESHPSVRYFHSYELVAHAAPERNFFLEDGRHVSPDGVAFIMNEFLRQYGAEEVAPEFVPFGRVETPDQTVLRRLRRGKHRLARAARRFRGLEG